MLIELTTELIIMSVSISDYDTNKTVQCSSSFVYDKSRQRSLQHFIEFEELPEKSRNIVLPSGEKFELERARARTQRPGTSSVNHPNLT